MFSSPSRGSYISTVNGVAYTLNATEAILVPFPGFLYLYISFDDLQMAFSEFSSLSRGSYISTLVLSSRLPTAKFSSPSRGPYISTIKRSYRTRWIKVLVPFPGFLYLYQYVLAKKSKGGIEVLVPFPGFLYLYVW